MSTVRNLILLKVMLLTHSNIKFLGIDNGINFLYITLLGNLLPINTVIGKQKPLYPNSNLLIKIRLKSICTTSAKYKRWIRLPSDNISHEVSCERDILHRDFFDGEDLYKPPAFGKN